MQIKETNNPNYLIITEPTTEAAQAAKTLARGNWAKIEDNRIIVHKNFRNKFETMMRIDDRNMTVVPEFAAYSEKEAWLYANFNSMKAAEYYNRLHPEVFNREYAGQTIEELENYALQD